MVQKNIKQKQDLFSALPDLGITITELQRHVADSPAPRIRYRYPVIALIAAIGFGLYIVFGSQKPEKNIAGMATSVKKSAPLSSMPSIQTQNLKDTKIANALSFATKIKRIPKVLHGTKEGHSAVLVLKDSALIDPKIFNAVCGRNVFIASTAKIDPMQQLDPASDSFNALVNIPARVFSNSN